MVQARSGVTLVLHGAGAWKLLFRPGGLQQLQMLLDTHTFWAKGRSPSDLKQMLRGSQAAVTAWRGRELVGFGRATSDGLFRAVLWDVVVAANHQGAGLGSQLVKTLLEAPALRDVERTYLMTTNSASFYSQLGFEPMGNQKLMMLKRNNKSTRLGLDRFPRELIDRSPRNN